MKQKSSESWNGGGWMVVTQEFQQEQLFVLPFTNLFFLAMCQIRQHKDSMRRLRSCELRIDDACNKPAKNAKKSQYVQ